MRMLACATLRSGRKGPQHAFGGFSVCRLEELVQLARFASSAGSRREAGPANVAVIPSSGALGIIWQGA